MSEISYFAMQNNKNAIKYLGGSFFGGKADIFGNTSILRVSVQYYKFRLGKSYRNLGFGNFAIYSFWSTTGIELDTISNFVCFISISAIDRLVPAIRPYLSRK